MPIITLDPASIGSDNAFSVTGAGGNKVTAVLRPDDDATSYIWWQGGSSRQSFNKTAVPGGIVSLNGNTMRYRGQVNDATGGSTEAIVFGALLGGTYLADGGISVGGGGLSGWLTGSHTQTRPAGGSWTVSDLNSAEMYCQAPMTASSSTGYCSTFYWDWDVTFGTGGLVFLLLSLGPLVAVGVDRMPALASALWRARSVRLLPGELAAAHRQLREHRHRRFFLPSVA